MLRCTRMAQNSSPRALAASMPTKKPPKPSAAMSARPTPAPVRDPGRAPSAALAASREASTTPMRASATPSPCTALGLSPVATPTVSGTTAAVADMGATTLIVPTASPR